MILIRHALLLISCVLISVLPALGGPDPLPVDGHHSSRSGIAMDHQGGVTLQLDVHYLPAEGARIPDEEAIMETALNFLESYPNTTDYFEIVNRNLNAHVRTQHPELERLDVRFTLEPRPTVPFAVLSQSTYEAGRLDEFYGFNLNDVESANPLLIGTDIRVWFQYKPNLAAADIPDVRDVHREALRWLNLPPDDADTRSNLGRELAASLMLRYEAITRAWVRIRDNEEGFNPHVARSGRF